MDIINENGQPVYNSKIIFKGDGWDLFGILILNWILTMITLGLYYPWAKAKKLQYLFSQCDFAGTRFTFHGTGKEMFIGFIKAYGLFLGLFILLIAGTFSQNQLLMFAAIALFYIAIFVLMPFAIHGMMRYRSSRTSWRGIHWGYRGNRGTLIGKFIGGLLLTMITLGIYGSWFVSNLRTYIIGNTRFGSVQFSYTGKGFDLFIINLKGIFFTLFTLGIYFFWYKRNYHNYFINNIFAEQDGKQLPLKATTTAGGYFELLIINLLLTIFTLGLAFPWVQIRTLRFFFSNLEMHPEFNPANITQTEEEYKNAMGEDIGDMMDIGIV